MKKDLAKALKIYNYIEEILIVFMFVVMVAVIFLQVVSRYIFNNSISWSEALGRYLFVWVSWLGVSIGAREGEHIKITMLVERMPKMKAEIVNIISELIVIIIAGATIYYSTPLTRILIGNNVMENTLHICQVWGFLAVPVGSALMIFRCIVAIVKSIDEIRHKNFSLEKGGEM